MAEIFFDVVRDGVDVDVKIGPFAGIDSAYHFSHEFDDEIEAEMWLRTVAAEAERRITAIRRAAYERGFKAARNKSLAMSEFSGCINTEACVKPGAE